jgi:hypothetical protein
VSEPRRRSRGPDRARPVRQAAALVGGRVGAGAKRPRLRSAPPGAITGSSVAAVAQILGDLMRCCGAYAGSGDSWPTGHVERVTGIEPAWPAWKAGDSQRHRRWSAPSQVDAVPSTCLSEQGHRKERLFAFGRSVAGRGLRSAALSPPRRPREARPLLPSLSRTISGSQVGTVSDGACAMSRDGPGGSSTETASVRAVDRDGEGSADLAHARVCQPSEPLNEGGDRDALH